MLHDIIKHSTFHKVINSDRLSMVNRYEYMSLMCGDSDHDNHLILSHTVAVTLIATWKEESPPKYAEQKIQMKNWERWTEVSHWKDYFCYLIFRLTMAQNNSTQQITKPNTAHTTMRLRASFTENFRWLAAGFRDKKKLRNRQIVRLNDGNEEVQFLMNPSRRTMVR